MSTPHVEPSVTELLRRSRRSERSETRGDRRMLTAQLYLSPAAMVRLLSVTGTQSEFILSGIDGRTTVRVGLSVATVPDSQLAIGERGVVLDWSRSTLSYRGSRVTLTRMELRLLLALMEHAPEPATFQSLIEALWDGHRGYAEHLAALPVWICALRRRLSAIGVSRAIHTVRRVGYSLQL